ncbi:hypothetical protein GCM10020256_39410 [Streptomyces thermocoprophilus]
MRRGGGCRPTCRSGGGGDLLHGGAEFGGTVDAVQLIGAQQVFEGEADARGEREPGLEDVGVCGRCGERGEGGVGGEAPYEGGAYGGVERGVFAAGVHVAVPGEQPCRQFPRGRGESAEAGQMVQQGCAGGEVGVGVDGGHVGRRPGAAGVEEGADAVGAVRWGELDAEGGSGAALVGHDGDAVGESGAGRLVPAGPLVAGFPRGHGSDAVGVGADGHPAGDAVQEAAVGVGGLDDVDGFGPQVEGVVDVGDGAGAQQRQQRAEAEVGGDAGRGAQAERERGAVVEAFGAAGDDGAAVGLDDLDLDGVLAGDLDGLGVAGGAVPAPVGAECLDAGAGAAQPLVVEVLVVGHGVGDGPGDGAGVAEVGEAGDAGDGEADDVELVAGEPYLLVDAGVLDEPVRVAGEDRLPGGGAVAGEEPAVAAGGAGAVGGEQADRVGPQVPYRLLAPQFGGEPGEQDVRGQPDAERGPRLPAAGGEAGRVELGGRRCAGGRR